ncbi:hypothetical protein Y032_0189g1222 [Ancylostoma ceylanicum]|nr:hypothetical protein Y032_0189g1222 [Ancylostoma ceylanicum]
MFLDWGFLYHIICLEPWLIRILALRNGRNPLVSGVSTVKRMFGSHVFSFPSIMCRKGSRRPVIFSLFDLNRRQPEKKENKKRKGKQTRKEREARQRNELGNGKEERAGSCDLVFRKASGSHAGKPECQ